MITEDGQQLRNLRVPRIYRQVLGDLDDTDGDRNSETIFVGHKMNCQSAREVRESRSATRGRIKNTVFERGRGLALEYIQGE